VAADEVARLGQRKMSAADHQRHAAPRGGISHGSCVSAVNPATIPSATRLTIVSTTMTWSLCLGGAELTYQGELPGAVVAACVTENLPNGHTAPEKLKRAVYLEGNIRLIHAGYQVAQGMSIQGGSSMWWFAGRRFSLIHGRCRRPV
jgi:hypothetical protein